MWFSLLTLLSLITVVRSAALNKRVNATDPWFLERFSSLITFGDSYTDENRLNYFISNHGAAPPPGTLLPEVPSLHLHLRSLEPDDMVELQDTRRRPHLAPLCSPVHRQRSENPIRAPAQSLRLCRQWCRLLQPDNPTFLTLHQRRLSLRPRVRNTCISERLQVCQ